MTRVTKDVFECITVEIYMEKSFKQTYTVTSQKVFFICVDFNIDLLNSHNHKPTEEFINTMYSLSLFPRITRPSRITHNSATLIDDIFTNILNNNTISGSIIQHISDHLPVFVVSDNFYIKNKEKIKPRFKRVRPKESIKSFKD